MSVVSSVSHGFIYGFWQRWRILVVKMKDFWWRWRIFWWRLWIFLFRQCLHCILMREVPALSMCTHTNEGILSTEHVQMLHWACADMLMRGNPVTDWTHYTHNWNPNRQCLHTWKYSADNQSVLPWFHSINLQVWLMHPNHRRRMGQKGKFLRKGVIVQTATINYCLSYCIYCRK